MTNARPSFDETDFRKSTRSDPDQVCVHIARRAGWVQMRDTKTVFGSADDRRLTFTDERFAGFLAQIRP